MKLPMHSELWKRPEVRLFLNLASGLLEKTQLLMKPMDLQSSLVLVLNFRNTSVTLFAYVAVFELASAFHIYDTIFR